MQQAQNKNFTQTNSKNKKQKDAEKNITLLNTDNKNMANHQLFIYMTFVIVEVLFAEK